MYYSDAECKGVTLSIFIMTLSYFIIINQKYGFVCGTDKYDIRPLEVQVAKIIYNKSLPANVISLAIQLKTN